MTARQRLLRGQSSTHKHGNFFMGGLDALEKVMNPESNEDEEARRTQRQLEKEEKNRQRKEHQKRQDAKLVEETIANLLNTQSTDKGNKNTRKARFHSIKGPFIREVRNKNGRIWKFTDKIEAIQTLQ